MSIITSLVSRLLSTQERIVGGKNKEISTIHVTKLDFDTEKELPPKTRVQGLTCAALNEIKKGVIMQS